MKAESLIDTVLMAFFEWLVAGVSDVAEKKQSQSQSDFFGFLSTNHYPLYT
jgi:hypothetical protein